MGLKSFDRKFGADFLRELPASPAVYLFKDEQDRVLYVGKAKNVRRRLASYRNAGRRKAHRKMRALVRESHAVEVRLQPSEGQALRVENELIRTLRPSYNVDGAFDFLYPAIGVGRKGHQTLVCFTSKPEAYADLELRWHGTFRPRLRARDAFDALLECLSRIGHREPRSRLPGSPRMRGSVLVAYRRLPDEFVPSLDEFFDGISDALLEKLFVHLLERPDARRDAALVQDTLRSLREFYRDDVRKLARARLAAGRDACFVPRSERDALFIEARTSGSA